MACNRIARVFSLGMMALCLNALLAPCAWPQPPGKSAAAVPAPVSADQPDAQRTRDDLSALLDRYPPNLRTVLALDPGLLANENYLGTYPALLSFLHAHPEVSRNPAFYIGASDRFFPHANRSQATEVMENVLGGLAVLCGLGMAIGLVIWLIKTLVDYKRWSRLAKVQTEAHTKLLDRFTANEDLLSYIKTPAGAKFLESSPIRLDASPRSVGAPLSRILWSVQGGVVLLAGGIGLQFVGVQVAGDAQEPLRALGILSIALGFGFVISAIISYVISRRLGLIEPPASGARTELPGI
jgi:hypothetical protein